MIVIENFLITLNLMSVFVFISGVLTGFWLYSFNAIFLVLALSAYLLSAKFSIDIGRMITRGGVE